MYIEFLIPLCVCVCVCVCVYMYTSVFILFSDFYFFPVFKPEELRQALMPTLESLYRQDPESLPFRMPVDPQLLCIPVCIPADAEMYLFLF